MTLTFILVGALALFAQSGGGPPLLVGRPPSSMSRNQTWDQVEVVSGPYFIYGSTNHSGIAKDVAVQYYATTTPGGLSAVATGGLYETVSYWPTAMAIMDDETVAVAGKGSDPGEVNTVIEVWRITLPQVLTSIDPTTGQPVQTIGPVQVRSRSVVYNEATVGRDMVRGLVKLRGKPYSMLVQFFDSGDVYELDYTQAILPSTPPPSPRFPLTKVLRATPGVDVPFVSELGSKDRVWITGATHPTMGYVYLWWPDFDYQISLSATGLPALPTVDLYDVDKNGTIDSWAVRTEAENIALGLLPSAHQYTEYGLCTHYWP